VHAGEALWNLYGLVTALERSMGTNVDALKALSGARNDLKTISDFISVPVPSDAELAPRVPKITFAAPAARQESAGEARPMTSPDTRPKVSAAERSEQMAEALSLCDAILDTADEVPEAGEEWMESVAAKVKSMKESIEQHNGCTPRMLTALQNMRHGQEKWLQHE